MTYVFTKRTLGARINASRLARKLSQVAVARRTGIAASYLSRIESGRVHPTLGTALRIASALRMSLDDLTGPSPPERKDRPCPVSPSGHCMMDLIDVNAELGGGAGAGHLLVVDDLHHVAGGQAAVLLGPAEGEPASRGELALEGAQELEA